MVPDSSHDDDPAGLKPMGPTAEDENFSSDEEAELIESGKDDVFRPTSSDLPNLPLGSSNDHNSVPPCRGSMARYHRTDGSRHRY